MSSLIEEALAVETRVFYSWEDADRFCVRKIFSFSEQCGNSSLGDVVELVSNVLKGNPYIDDMEFRYDNEIDFLKSIIDQYIESDLNNLEPNLFRSFNNPVNIIAAHQAMFLLMAHSAISLFGKLQDDEKYNSFINVFLYFLIVWIINIKLFHLFITTVTNNLSIVLFHKFKIIIYHYCKILLLNLNFEF